MLLVILDTRKGYMPNDIKMHFCVFAQVHGVQISQKYQIKIISNMWVVVCILFAYVCRHTSFTKHDFHLQ